MGTLTKIKKITTKPESIKRVSIEKIKQNEKSQSRMEINQDVVSDYAEAAKDKAIFPAIDLFYDGKSYYIGDGWHRILAFKQVGFKTIEANVRAGGLREAILHSVGSNAAHGLRRTNADKRKAVVMLLQDKEWVLWSDREIARQATVGNKLVSRMRKDYLSVSGTQIEHKKVKRNGKEYVMETANIGSENTKTAIKANKDKVKTVIAQEVSVNNILYPSGHGKAQKKERVLFKIFGWKFKIEKIK